MWDFRSCGHYMSYLLQGIYFNPPGSTEWPPETSVWQHVLSHPIGSKDAVKIQIKNELIYFQTMKSSCKINYNVQAIKLHLFHKNLNQLLNLFTVSWCVAKVTLFVEKIDLLYILCYVYYMLCTVIKINKCENEQLTSSLGFHCIWHLVRLVLPISKWK